MSLIFCDSFIKRMKKFSSIASNCRRHRIINNKLLKLDKVTPELAVHGVFGATIGFTPLPLSLLRKMKLSTVLLSICINGRPILNVAVDLMETASKLVDHYSVKHVIIMQIMNRVTANPNISTERTAHCNTILRSMCEVEQHTFRHLKGYSQDAAIWTIDGIHRSRKKLRKTSDEL